MLNIFRLRYFYIKLLRQNLYYFLAALFLLACSPIISSYLFEYIVIHNNYFPPLILFTIVLLLIILLFSFISISIWSSIKSELHGTKKLLLILFSYIMLWFAFGNLYYFLLDMENYLSLKNLVTTGLLTIPSDFWQHNQLIKNIAPFWQYNFPEEQYLASNRYIGYINSLYFSGTTMLTIGYGDFVPATPFLKIISLLQAFLAQFINVVAVGIWLNGLKK